MDKGIVTLEELKKDELFRVGVLDNAEKCNLDIEKVYKKMLDILADYNDVDYVNRKLPEMMNYFVFGYQMCYNPHVKYKCSAYFEKGYS